MKLSKFQEVCKVSSKFDMSRKVWVASLHVWPRSVSHFGKGCDSHRWVTKTLPKH
jgi:hypothetical protein